MMAKRNPFNELPFALQAADQGKVGKALGKKSGKGGFANALANAQRTQRTLTATPNRSMTATPNRSMTATPTRSIEATPTRTLTATPRSMARTLESARSRKR